MKVPELGDIVAYVKSLEAEVTQLRAEVDAAYVRGLEDAKRVAETQAGKRCLVHQKSGKGICGFEIANEIAALIPSSEEKTK